MKDITIILPIHKFILSEDGDYLRASLNSVVKCQSFYPDKLKLLLVGPTEVIESTEVLDIVKETIGGSEIDWQVLNNTGATDFCSQVNFAAQNVDTDYFSVLEFDDEYMPKWFKLAQTYYPTHEDVSLFLPLTIQNDGQRSNYVNELVWAMAFADVMGEVDSNCLQNTTAFNLTGGIFNTKDFNHVGGFDSSVEIAFSYDLLLRLTAEYKLKVYVVPRMGYGHLLGRKGSLLDEYKDKYNDQTAADCFLSIKEKYITPVEENQENG